MKHITSAFILSFFMIAIGCSQKSGTSVEKMVYPALDHKVINISDYDNYLNLDGHDNLEIATVAGGCFWCTEAAFERIEGVVDVISGYSGGEEQYPSYKDVCDRLTGHTESINVYFDPNVIDYETILDVLFTAHDPTQLNRQGNDIGPQYRSEIFYHNDDQKRIAEGKIESLTEAKKYSKPIVTLVTAYKDFWVAEGYHQNFYELNPNQGYVYAVSRPKVNKVMKNFAERLKPQFR